MPADDTVVNVPLLPSDEQLPNPGSQFCNMRARPAQVKSDFRLLIEQEKAKVLILRWGSVMTNLNDELYVTHSDERSAQQQQADSYVDSGTLDSVRASAIRDCSWFHEFVVEHLGS